MDDLQAAAAEAELVADAVLEPEIPMEQAEHDAPGDSEASPDAVDPVMDADALRQQISEFFPMVWVGDLAGETFEDVLAALPDALEKSRQTRSEQQPDAVPSGPMSRSAVIDLESLSPESKIRAGLRR